jgi:hypothetical protein
MKNRLIICVLLLIAGLFTTCTKDANGDDKKTTHSVVFKITSSTNSTLTGVAISYDITDGTRVRDLFVKCSAMPWQSSNYSNIASGMGVGITALVNNGPSYGGNGDINVFILVDNQVWKSTTVTMTTGASISLGGTLP